LVNLKSAKQKKEQKDLKDQKQESFSQEFSGIDNVTRALTKASLKELSNLEKMVSFLGTTANATPFIGLFGTVWGIMITFIDIGAMKDTSIAVVAPGLSTALTTTALGLMAAIPAVIFYNIFISKIKELSNEMDNFSSDFLNILKRHFLI
jgi:biopolymer transport protein TolQ